MKTTFFYSILIMISLSLMSMTCTSDDDPIDDNSQEINQVINSVEDSTWKVTSFIDSGQDETQHFNGYNFTFENNGALIATKGNTTINGTWSVTDSSNSSSSNSSDDIDFNISFSASGNDNFDDLTEDWDIVTHTDTVLSLIHISGGNGGTDTLIFNKN